MSIEIVNLPITVEIVIFHSYVSLPESTHFGTLPEV